MRAVGMDTSEKQLNRRDLYQTSSRRAQEGPPRLRDPYGSLGMKSKLLVLTVQHDS